MGQIVDRPFDRLRQMAARCGELTELSPQLAHTEDDVVAIVYDRRRLKTRLSNLRHYVKPREYPDDCEGQEEDPRHAPYGDDLSDLSDSDDEFDPAPPAKVVEEPPDPGDMIMLALAIHDEIHRIEDLKNNGKLTPAVFDTTKTNLLGILLVSV